MTALWSAPSNGDLWAVGSEKAGPGFDGFPFVLRRSAGAWSKLPTPQTEGYLLAVWGDRDDNVWAVGTKGLILHWDGTTWSREESGVVEPLRRFTAQAAPPGSSAIAGRCSCERSSRRAHADHDQGCVAQLLGAARPFWTPVMIPLTISGWVTAPLFRSKSAYEPLPDPHCPTRWGRDRRSSCPGRRPGRAPPGWRWPARPGIPTRR